MKEKKGNCTTHDSYDTKFIVNVILIMQMGNIFFTIWTVDVKLEYEFINIRSSLSGLLKNNYIYKFLITKNNMTSNESCLN